MPSSHTLSTFGLFCNSGDFYSLGKFSPFHRKVIFLFDDVSSSPCYRLSLGYLYLHYYAELFATYSKGITYQHPTTIFAWVDNLFHFLRSSRLALSWCILMNFCFLPLFSLKYIWYINIWNRNSRNNEKIYKKNQQTKNNQLTIH